MSRKSAWRTIRRTSTHQSCGGVRATLTVAKEEKNWAKLENFRCHVIHKLFSIPSDLSDRVDGF